MRSHALTCLGRGEEAREIVEAAFTANPDSPDLWFALATLCAESSIDPSEAVAQLVARHEDDGITRLFAWLRQAPAQGVDAIAVTAPPTLTDTAGPTVAAPLVPSVNVPPVTDSVPPPVIMIPLFPAPSRKLVPLLPPLPTSGDTPGLIVHVTIWPEALPIRNWLELNP